MSIGSIGGLTALSPGSITGSAVAQTQPGQSSQPTGVTSLTLGPAGQVHQGGQHHHHDSGGHDLLSRSGSGGTASSTGTATSRLDQLA